MTEVSRAALDSTKLVAGRGCLLMAGTEDPPKGRDASTGPTRVTIAVLCLLTSVLCSLTSEPLNADAFRIDPVRTNSHSQDRNRISPPAVPVVSVYAHVRFLPAALPV